MAESESEERKELLQQLQHIPATGRNILRLPWASRNSKHKDKGLSWTTAVVYSLFQLILLFYYNIMYKKMYLNFGNYQEICNFASNLKTDKS